jgi:SAM-dependent methyltransferase
VVCPRIAAWFVTAALVLSGCAALEREFADNRVTDGLPLAFDPEVPYFPTPDQAVDSMLKLAGTGPRDVVYDLGCGDGRIVIAAAKFFGARAVGIDIDPLPLRMAVSSARRAGVEGRVRFVRGDLFEADIHEATVVTLFLLENVNRRLLPKLLRELEPGTRIVAHRYNFGDAWPPQKTVKVGESTIFFWTVPKR